MWWCCRVDVNSGSQPCSWKWAKPNKEQSESQTVREKHSLLILHPHEFDQNWFNYNGLGSLDTPGGTGEGLLSAPNVITQMEDLGLLILDSVLQSDPGQAASPETFSMFHLNRALPGGGRAWRTHKEIRDGYLLVNANCSLQVPPTRVLRKSSRCSNSSDRRENSNWRWFVTTSYPLGRLLRKQNNMWWRGWGETGTLVHRWGDYKTVQKVNTELPYDPTIPLLGRKQIFAHLCFTAAASVIVTGGNNLYAHQQMNG